MHVGDNNLFCSYLHFPTGTDSSKGAANTIRVPQSVRKNLPNA